MAPAPTSWSAGFAASSSSSPERGSTPGARVGREGFLRLAFERRGDRTVLTERRFSLPLQALEPMDLDGSGAAALMLLNPTGGVLGGDVLDTEVVLGAGAHACLTTVAATRIYRSAGPPARQRLRAVVGAGARLEYMPDHLIPSPGARLCQTTEVTLGSGATLLLVDAWAVGRAARGETWGFDTLDASLAVTDARGLLLKDRSMVDGARRDGLGETEGFPYLATFVALAPGRDGWDELADDLFAAMGGVADGVRFGATPLGRGGLLVRMLCPSAPTLTSAVRTIWAECRRRLLGLAPLPLRKF
jgi:urease accessory protein